ncbi:hypothetical protein [Actinomycetospora aeridis]|uniref:Secreted protein n=1 Tax=Actinomycetospora aeridis TaxID=3129231 RepID=A0ABU8N6J5_9PSEU
MKMLAVAGGAAVAALAWAVAPWVHLRRHGTLDEQTVRGWRAEAAALEEARQAQQARESRADQAAAADAAPDDSVPRIPRPRTRSSRRARDTERAVTRSEEDPAVSSTHS